MLSEGTTNRQPPLDLLVTPYIRDVPVPARLLSNDRPLGDGKGSRDAPALFEVFQGERSVDVLRCASARKDAVEDRHYAVLLVGRADADRLEEFWKRGGRQKWHTVREERRHFGAAMSHKAS
jgi:hypothetical protein